MQSRLLLLVLIFMAIGCRSPKVILQNQEAISFGYVDDSPAELTAFQTGESRTIEQFVQLGLAQNPAIAEALHKVDVARYQIPQALALPDPMLNTSTYLAPVQTAAGEQAFALGISQKFVNADRRTTKAAIILENVRVAESEVVKVQLEVAEKIRVACYQVLFVRQAIELTTEDIESLDQISEVVLRQYEVKQSVTQQDVLNVQIERSKVENELTDLHQKEKSFRGRLARLVHLAPGSDLEILDSLSISEDNLDLDRLTTQAIHSRPELSAQLANIRRDRKRICLAELENKPDVTVGLSWIATSTNGISPVANGDDAVLLGVGFNLPINKNRIRAGVNEATSASLASTSRLASLKDEVAEEVFDLIAKADSSRETLLLLQEDIIPKATRTLDLSIDEYANGDVKYVQLIENWRALLRYRIAESRLVSQYNQTIASLARSVGSISTAASN